MDDMIYTVHTLVAAYFLLMIQITPQRLRNAANLGSE